MLKFILHRLKGQKIIVDLPSYTPRHYNPLTTQVARELHRHCKSVGWIPAGGPIVNSFFSTVPDLNLSFVDSTQGETGQPGSLGNRPVGPLRLLPLLEHQKFQISLFL